MEVCDACRKRLKDGHYCWWETDSGDADLDSVPDDIWDTFCVCDECSGRLFVALGAEFQRIIKEREE